MLPWDGTWRPCSVRSATRRPCGSPTRRISSAQSILRRESRWPWAAAGSPITRARSTSSTTFSGAESTLRISSATWTLDRVVHLAETAQTTDPAQTLLLWQKADREAVDQAPWVPLTNSLGLDVVSHRVGNYEHNPQWGILLDQLWVK